MGKRFEAWLRGFGSVLDLAPQNRLRAPIYYVPPKSPAEEIAAAWESVGKSAWAALDSFGEVGDEGRG